MSLAELVVRPARTRSLELWDTFTRTRSAEEARVVTLTRTIAIGLAAIVLAFHYSLSTLINTLSLNTPLAYLGLVPVIALALAALRAKPKTAEPAIYDRQVDYIVGIPLLAAALAISVFLPVKLSSQFWVYRIDLLALPLFVAGTIVLLFGVRALWRLKFAVGYLLFAWPTPYTMLLLNQLDAFTNATLAGLRVALKVIPVAHQIPGSDGSLFQLGHGSHGFAVSVASACSGVNGLVGYGLLSIAFLALVRGSILRKVVWLAVGLVLVWALNVVRIMAIFAAGSAWGETVAIDGLHPVLGLFTFGLAVLVMLKLMPRFGLSLPLSKSRKQRTAARDVGGEEPRRRPPVPKTRLAILVVLVFALMTGVANADLRSFDFVVNSMGAPRLSAFQTKPSHPEGWQVGKTNSYDWTRSFFGADSKWYRYQFTQIPNSKTDLHSSSTVIADVINTSDASTFSAYGIEACYSFHGYSLKSTNRVNLGGIYAQVVLYHNNAINSDWVNVYFIWPVKSPSGATRYERVNLMMIDSANVHFTGKLPSAGAANALGFGVTETLSGKVNGGTSQSQKVEQFLVGFAAEVVKAQAPAPDTNA
jgi:exosortase